MNSSTHQAAIDLPSPIHDLLTWTQFISSFVSQVRMAMHPIKITKWTHTMGGMSGMKLQFAVAIIGMLFLCL